MEEKEEMLKMLNTDESKDEVVSVKVGSSKYATYEIVFNEFIKHQEKSKENEVSENESEPETTECCDEITNDAENTGSSEDRE